MRNNLVRIDILANAPLDPGRIKMDEFMHSLGLLLSRRYRHAIALNETNLVHLLAPRIHVIGKQVQHEDSCLCIDEDVLQ
jgi:hypothetical protein